jgi:hypothetical protein
MSEGPVREDTARGITVQEDTGREAVQGHTAASLNLAEQIKAKHGPELARFQHDLFSGSADVERMHPGREIAPGLSSFSVAEAKRWNATGRNCRLELPAMTDRHLAVTAVATLGRLWRADGDEPGVVFSVQGHHRKLQRRMNLSTMEMDAWAIATLGPQLAAGLWRLGSVAQIREPGAATFRAGVTYYQVWMDHSYKVCEPPLDQRERGQRVLPASLER